MQSFVHPSVKVIEVDDSENSPGVRERCINFAGKVFAAEPEIELCEFTFSNSEFFFLVDRNPETHVIVSRGIC